jgi:hypothetical protein
LARDKEKKPRASAGLESNEVELMKGTDWLKARPAVLFAGSRVGRNASAWLTAILQGRGALELIG